MFLVMVLLCFWCGSVVMVVGFMFVVFGRGGSDKSGDG